MKIKAKPSFKKLSIGNNYQGLRTDQFYLLRDGEEIEVDEINPYIEGHVKEVEEKDKPKPK